MEVGCGVGGDALRLERNQPRGLCERVAGVLAHGLHEEDVAATGGACPAGLGPELVGDVTGWDVCWERAKEGVNLPVTRGAEADLVISTVSASVLHLDDVMLLAGEFAADEAGCTFPRGDETLLIVFASDGVLAAVRSAVKACGSPSGEEGESILALGNRVPELAQESSETGLPRGF